MHAVPTAIKTTDGLLVTRKTDLSAIPDFEADSSPTLKRMPDENLIKASREGSRPHNSVLISRSAPLSAVDSGILGRSTPTLQAQPSLISASRPRLGAGKPAVPQKLGTTPPGKPAVAVVAPAAKAPVEVAPPVVSNVPDPLPPSAESPSMGLAGDGQ